MGDVRDELKHYGVLGMHWGHRKGSSSSAYKIATAGQKAAKKVGEYAKETGKLAVNAYAHPIMTNKANRESRKSGSVGDQIRRATLYSTTKEIKDVNDRVANQVRQKKAAKEARIKARSEAKSQLKAAKNAEQYKKAAKQYTDSLLKNAADKSPKAWLKEAGEVTLNNWKHPGLTRTADYESKNNLNRSFSSRFRREMFYSNTNELRDVNQRIYQAIMDRTKS